MNKHEYESLSRQAADDEIDLVHLVQVLLKRKYLILGIFIFCIFAGGGYALLKEPVYEYTTILEIGTILAGAGDGDGDGETVKRTGIETSAGVKSKLEKVFIPMAVAQIKERHKGQLFSADVKEQKNTDIILISSKGRLEDGHILEDLHAMAVSPLIANHHEYIASQKRGHELLVERARLILKDLEDPRLFEIKEKNLHIKIESAQMALTGLNEQGLILLAEKTGLDKTRQLISKRIKRLKASLAFSYEKRDSAIDEVDDAANAMSLLILSSEIQQSENQLIKLEERLFVELENKKQQLTARLADNQRTQKLQVQKIEEKKSQLLQLKVGRESDQQQQHNTIAATKNKMNLYKDTKTLSLAMPSIMPVNPGKPLILALAGILGLMGGIFIAFMAEFIAKVRQQQQDDGKEMIDGHGSKDK